MKPTEILKIEGFIIVLLWLCCLVSVVLLPVAEIQFILGMAGLIAVTVTYRKFHDFSLVSLSFLLLLSVFNIVKFSIAFGFSFGSINIYSLLLLIILLLIRSSSLLKISKEWFGNDSNTIANKNSQVEFFKDKFRNLSDAQLEKRLRDTEMVEEARLALQQLLDEKHKQ